MDNTDDIEMVTGGDPTKTQILQLMYTAYRKMENLHLWHDKGKLNDEDFEKGILALYLWVKDGGQDLTVDAEAIESLAQ